MAAKGKFSMLDIMNQKSRNSATGETNVKDYTEIWLNPKEVKEAPQNTRQQCENIEQLADSFLLVGQEQSTVLARVNGEYRIIDGHRRNLANIMNLERGHNAYEKVRYFYKDMSETMYELSLLAGNGFTQDLTAYEKTELAARWKKALEKAKAEGEIKLEGRIRDIVGEIIGEKPTQMARIETINNNLTEEAKEQFKQGHLGMSAAYETARLPEEQQKEIAEQVASGEKVQAKDIAQKVKEKKDQDAAERMEKAAERAEKAAKKAQDASISAAQATVQAERAAENADMSAEHMQESVSYVSESDTNELLNMMQQYPDSEVMVKMADNTVMQVTGATYYEDYDAIELDTKKPCIPAPEKKEHKQEPLPTLTNNEKRKEWLESYESWLLWIDQKETGERCYKYDFDNGSSVVVRTSLTHAFKGYQQVKELEYGCEEYFLVGAESVYTTGKGYDFKMNPNLTFHESGCSKSMIVDYLKWLQK